MSMAADNENEKQNFLTFPRTNGAVPTGGEGDLTGLHVLRVTPFMVKPILLQGH